MYEYVYSFQSRIMFFVTYVNPFYDLHNKSNSTTVLNIALEPFCFARSIKRLELVTVKNDIPISN